MPALFQPPDRMPMLDITKCTVITRASATTEHSEYSSYHGDTLTRLDYYWQHSRVAHIVTVRSIHTVTTLSVHANYNASSHCNYNVSSHCNYTVSSHCHYNVSSHCNYYVSSHYNSAVSSYSNYLSGELAAVR